MKSVPKTRTYILLRKASPITFQLRSRHKGTQPLLWYDQENEESKALRYLTNQPSIFEDEQKEPYILGSIVFEDGKLTIPHTLPSLQKFLELHPDNEANGGVVFKEYDPEKEHSARVDQEMVKFKAQEAVFSLEPETLEAVGRVMFGARVGSMSISEIKFDLLRRCETDGQTILDLAKDTSVKLVNLAKRALEANLLYVKENGVTLAWGSNKKNIVDLPFGVDHPKAIAQYFQTTEGVELMKNMMTKLT